MLLKSQKENQRGSKEDPAPILLAKNGIGANSNGVSILLAEGYSTYSKYMSMIKQYPLIEVEEINSFIIDLNDESFFMPLSFSNLAAYLEKKQSKA